MPMRAFRASRAHVAGHMGENLWLWIGISAAGAAVSLAAIALHFRRRGGRGHRGPYTPSVES